MRIASMTLALGLLVGCATPPEVVRSLEGNLQALQQLEAELLPLVPDGPPIDFGVGARYRPRDGWRIQIRAWQLRAAGLLAWARDETFDHVAGYTALVAPAITEGRQRASREE